MTTKARPVLPDPFPLEILRQLNFGSADGHRDEIAIDREVFIATSSVKTFFQNKHSIIVGAIGTGKSTLFRLLKEKSSQIDAYKKDKIIALEEALSFEEIHTFAKEHYSGREEKNLYQLIWKFNILSKIAASISELDGFPQNDTEKIINQFLVDSNHFSAYTNVVQKIKNLVSDRNIKFETKISDHPITFEISTSKKEKKKINLEEIQSAISKSIKTRDFDRVTVIIDKIDRFISGIEYQTQLKFITALLEVEDDLSVDDAINLKIFIRHDLFERLDFSNLGYDKVSDNTVRLRWSLDETLRFLATRIALALRNAKIAAPEQLIQATNLKEFELSIREKLILSNKIPAFIKKLFLKKKKIERGVNLLEKFDKAVITKLFPRNAIHFSPEDNCHKEISIFDFINLHFKDGNDICTPRYILVFLKEVAARCAAYYEENPDQICELILIEKDYEWDLFKKNCVYDAYISSKDIYIKNIGTVEPKWTQNFNILTSKKGNKTKFDFKWIRANIPDITEQESVEFLSFLQVIGFLKISETHQDIRKRTYELPILFKTSPPLKKTKIVDSGE